jgi:plasmid segregation protein ParM
MTTIVRAIDVGFGLTKFVTGSSNGRVECSHFPSLAFYAMSARSSDAIGGKRKTVCVPVDGLHFEVGPEVELAADRYRARQLHDGYTETAEYRALMAGALHYMRLDVIDLLVIGLPVAQFLARRAALEKAMTGSFSVGRKARVHVKRVLVVAQPQGALFDYGLQQVQRSAAAPGRSLVIDVGRRTFDWLVTRGMKVESNMSHSVARGVSDILMAIAAKVSAEIGEEFLALDTIDSALRNGKSLRIYQEDHDLKKFEPLVQHIAEQAVSALVSRMDATFDVEDVVLVGGGAYLFKRAVKRRFPKHRIHEVHDPLHANVRGFQLLGEQYVRERPDLFVDDAGMSTPAAAPLGEV